MSFQATPASASAARAASTPSDSADRPGNRLNGVRATPMIATSGTAAPLVRREGERHDLVAGVRIRPERRQHEAHRQVELQVLLLHTDEQGLDAQRVRDLHEPDEPRLELLP